MSRHERRPTAIDLFSGAGGATQGLRNAGFMVVGAIESDEAAADSYRANHGRTYVEVGDIRRVDAVAFLEHCGLAPGELTVLQACPPCQTWSSLGKRDAADERNDLLMECLRFVVAARPQAIILENVIGLRHDRRFRAFGRALRRTGYGVRTYITDAQAYGVPQRRKRLILLAVRGGDGRQLPHKIGVPRNLAKRFRPRTVGEALRRVRTDELHRTRNVSQVVLDRIASIPEGGSRFDLPEKLKLRCHTDLTRRSATSAYGRMSRFLPAPTLTTRCTTPACGPFIHPVEPRPITLREASLLQTFPPSYRFAGTYGQIERQIGNAIPVRFAEAIAVVLLGALRQKEG